MTEREVFEAALELPPESRVAYLDGVCGTDAALRQRLEALLRQNDQAGSFLEQPAAHLPSPPWGSGAGGEGLLPTVDEPAVTERPGTVIGLYKLLEQIGEGGFGVVFMAEQQQPVRRKVALKVLKPGMDTRQVVARFEAERQALALMDHPNIARVFDGGETALGRPYFVMELVRGVSLIEFCDQNHLPVRQRLELFVSICQAVQHAHQKGIIHRDLKPANVLVTLHDGVPVPKVIDFGIAKALGQQLTDKTLFTNFALMIGTPLYMSPEQAELSGLDIDTRSDIYSLGVLLYELLTGTTPFDAERLRTAAYDEIRRIIREEEPPRPSKRISSLGETLTAVSAQRQTDPKRLGQLFRDDLDWIVMKALEKDRNRRYESASAFAADVQRYLHDEPVVACPPSAWYTFRKFARRNRAALLSASAVVLVVLLAVVALAASNVLIRQEQARTREEKDRAEKAQKLAEDRAAEVHQGLERLKGANALRDRGQWYVKRLRWDDAHAAYTKALELRPDHAPVWVERGALYASLGLWDLAGADLARGFELQEPDTSLPWFQHALLRLYLGDTDAYRWVCRRLRERFSGALSPFFRQELVRASLLGPDGDADLDGLVQLQRLGLAGAPRSWLHLYLLGLAQYRAGQHEQAARRLQESLTAEPADWACRALSYPVLAMAHYRLDEAAEARQALDAAAATLDRWTRERYVAQERHWLNHQGAVAHWPVPWWDWLECQHYYREARLLIDGSAPPDDPRLHVLRARSLAGLRRHAQAEVEYAAASNLCPGDAQVRLEAHRNRGYACVRLRQWGEAAAEFAMASKLQPDDGHLWFFRAVAHLAVEDAGAYRQCCAAMVRHFEKTQNRRAAGNVVCACVLRDDALPDISPLVPLARVGVPAWDGGGQEYGAALYRAGKYDEAVRCFEAKARTYRRRAWDWCFLAMAHHRLGHGDAARRCLAEAARWIDEANREALDDPAGTRPAWGSWDERVVYPLLLREATELLSKDSRNENQESEKKPD
jgi:serine/threonine protein kinase/Flp pilus assembly protein TadD